MSLSDNSVFVSYRIRDSSYAVDRLDERLRQEVRDRDILTGRAVRTEVGVSGQAIGIGADGALLIEVEGRVQEIRAGGVMPIDSGAKGAT